jgi:hypothetical protein
MSEIQDKKISRRDAIKLLGAVAGASVLANLPSRWSKPEMTSGVLPAHAQTSKFDAINSCNLVVSGGGTDYAFGYSDVYVLSGQPGISMHYKLEIIPTAGTASLGYPANEGDVLSVAPPPGQAEVSFLIQASTYNINGKSTGTFKITWTFTNPSVGIGSCVQSFNYDFTLSNNN